MSPDQVKLVQDSFKLVMPIRAAAAELFYSRLFAIDRSTVPLFSGTDMNAQGAKLMATLGFVVGALREPQGMLDAVRALAARHVGYGVTPAHYESVGAALLWTLEQGLGSAFTPPVRDAWNAAYALLSSTMRDAAGAICAPSTIAGHEAAD